MWSKDRAKTLAKANSRKITGRMMNTFAASLSNDWSLGRFGTSLWISGCSMLKLVATRCCLSDLVGHRRMAAHTQDPFILVASVITMVVVSHTRIQLPTVGESAEVPTQDRGWRSTHL